MCYTYDNLSRVVKRTVVNLSDHTQTEENFTYDAAGNVTADADDTFSYDTNNRLTSYNGAAVSYDLDGNMLYDGVDAYTFDSANRLITVGDTTYTYNAENTRIRKQTGAFDTTYTYNTNARLSQLLTKTVNGTVTKYVYGRGLIGEEKQDLPFKVYHFDYRGSTAAITDVTGYVTDRFEYDTYGKQTEHTGSSFVIFGYNGRDGVVTDNNGLIYMRARYYKPELRRFVNADVLHGSIDDSTSLNRYAYVNGNPVSFVDPFGLCGEREDSSSRTQYTLPFKVVHRTDINGIGLLPDGTIVAGRNVTNEDILMLINIATMTSAGHSQDEILKIVNEYNERLKGNTVIKKDQTLEYYTTFEDITNKLMNEFLLAEYETFYSYGAEFFQIIKASKTFWPFFLEEFYNNVRNKGAWDLKQYSEWRQSSLYYFNGELVDSDAPGNIMFGYMGMAYGIPKTVLHMGAGYAQVSAGTSSIMWMASFFDDPMDSANVDRGIAFYEAIHS